jgi:hypothetical protein
MHTINRLFAKDVSSKHVVSLFLGGHGVVIVLRRRNT